MPRASSAPDRQSQSYALPDEAGPHQRLLTMSRRSSDGVDHGLVRRQPTLLAAIKLCISLAGLEADKEVYIPLGIDAGHWSRIMRGEAHFPVDRLCDLMDLCGNDAPMLWLVDRRGFDLSSLRRKESETERQLREARERISQLQAERLAERALISDLLTGRVHDARARVTLG